MASAFVHTVGHSNRAIDDFLALLDAYSVERLVDVRAVPRSRHNPQFAQSSLQPSLAGAGVEYRHMRSLGGLRGRERIAPLLRPSLTAAGRVAGTPDIGSRTPVRSQMSCTPAPCQPRPETPSQRRANLSHPLRRPASESINTGWRNLSFRAYADHMQTPEFARAIGELVGLARTGRTAIMCAEAVPWRCHRSLIADALLARGVAVIDILSATESRPHALTSFAHVEGTRITYPAPQHELPL